MFVLMGRKKRLGRPKMAPELKKQGFSVKVSPDLMRAINLKTAGRNRNYEIELALEKYFLPNG